MTEWQMLRILELAAAASTRGSSSSSREVVVEVEIRELDAPGWRT